VRIGNITQTQILERAIERFTFPIAIVRAGHLIENNNGALERARATGVFDSFLQPIDRPFPMAATADVGATVARLMVEDWTGKRVVEVGSYLTPDDIAKALGEAIGVPVDAKAIPRRLWASVLERMGLTHEAAANWEAMQDGFNSGWIDFGRSGTESVAGWTPAVSVFTSALTKDAAHSD
jgi:hypothetical protein